MINLIKLERSRLRYSFLAAFRENFREVSIMKPPFGTDTILSFSKTWTSHKEFSSLNLDYSLTRLNMHSYMFILCHSWLIIWPILSCLFVIHCYIYDRMTFTYTTDNCFLNSVLYYYICCINHHFESE